MARCRFVQPEVVTLPLTGGDSIVVKKRLTVGEERAIIASVIGSIKQDGSRTVDREMLGMGEVAAYLLEWTFRDAAGKTVSIDTDTKKLAALKGLDPESYLEIETAIDAHKAAMEVEISERKKGDGPIAPEAISSSAS